MTTVREATEADLGQVTQLFLKAFRKGPEHSPAVVERYFRELYFHNPWYDPAVSSLVIDCGDGVVTGFFGVVPMPLRVSGRSVRVAVGGNLMVDAERGDPMSTLRMMRRYLLGPHDLAFTDTANVAATKLWRGLGGDVARFTSTRWLLPLRPAAFAITSATRARHAGVGRAIRPLARPIDAMAAKWLRPAPPMGVHLRAIGVDELLALMSAVGNDGYVHFDGDAAGLHWLLDKCREKQQFGPLRQRALVGVGGELTGAVLYYPNRGGIGNVLYLIAKHGHHAQLLDELWADAWNEGSVALIGQADPHLLVALGERPSAYLQRNEFVTVHSKDTSLCDPILRGELGVSRLYGDWWTRMQGDVFA